MYLPIIFVLFLQIWSVTLLTTNLEERYTLILEECVDMIDEFSNASAELTRCFISNSRPLKICELCVERYIGFSNKYNKLQNFDTNCSNQVFNFDRLQVLRTIHDNNVKLWEKAKCNDCFVLENGKLTTNLSESVLKFRDHYKSLEKCLDSPNNDPNGLCVDCENVYAKLNRFYENMERKKNSACVDIVDAMNRTRFYWSKQLDCYQPSKYQQNIFLVCASVVCSIPVLFYLIVKVWVTKKHPEIMQQNRFVGSLSRANMHSQAN